MTSLRKQAAFYAPFAKPIAVKFVGYMGFITVLALAFGQPNKTDSPTTPTSGIEKVVERECPNPRNEEIHLGIPLKACKEITKYEPELDPAKIPTRQDATPLGALPAAQLRGDIWPFPVITSCVDIGTKATVFLTEDGTGYLQEGHCKERVKDLSWEPVALTQEQADMDLDTFLGPDNHDVKYLIADGQLYVRGSEGDGMHDFRHYKNKTPFEPQKGTKVQYVEPGREVPRGVKDFTHVGNFDEHGRVLLKYTSHGKQLSQIFEAPSLMVSVKDKYDYNDALFEVRRVGDNYFVVEGTQATKDKAPTILHDAETRSIIVSIGN